MGSGQRIRAIDLPFRINDPRHAHRIGTLNLFD
jgi:hypothetical protein